MGCGISKTELNNILLKIDKYNVGDVNEFQNIMQTLPKGCHTINIWKISCLYYFLVTQEEHEHDIGESCVMLINKFQEIEADVLSQAENTNLEIKKQAADKLYYLYKGTGNTQYLQKRNEIINIC